MREVITSQIIMPGGLFSLSQAAVNNFIFITLQFTTIVAINEVTRDKDCHII